MASQLGLHEFEQALRVGDGQGSLVFCSPWGHTELDMTEQLHFTFTLHSLEGLMLKLKTPVFWSPDAKN